MNKEIMTFDDIEVEKSKLYYYKHLIIINNISIDKIIFDMVSLCRICF